MFQHKRFSCVGLCVVAVTMTAITRAAPQTQPREQCPLRQELVLEENGRRLVVVPVLGGMGAAAARTSCLAHSSSPLFLNSQEDADILHRLLKDCVKARRMSSVWVPARRHVQHKRIHRPVAEAPVASSGHVEYDWMSAHYNRTSDDIVLLPFPKEINERKGIICVRRD
ncbi:uncharacterized protein LOC119572850 isoform X1 [Penaeus monodon]|uniref:uncharacterized protein LOC119572850 isoform X1 n=1 Tax=Penaeus monodon TaxID=6687 RepID=UPI0018A7A226|nr:uncharacterized protein LOC119572850 isoform X1 [Penaeus monodon]